MKRNLLKIVKSLPEITLLTTMQTAAKSSGYIVNDYKT